MYKKGLDGQLKVTHDIEITCYGKMREGYPDIYAMKVNGHTLFPMHPITRTSGFYRDIEVFISSYNLKVFRDYQRYEGYDLSIIRANLPNNSHLKNFAEKALYCFTPSALVLYIDQMNGSSPVGTEFAKWLKDNVLKWGIAAPTKVENKPSVSSLPSAPPAKVETIVEPEPQVKRKRRNLQVEAANEKKQMELAEKIANMQIDDTKKLALLEKLLL